MNYIESPEGGREDLGPNVLITKKGHSGNTMTFSVIEIGFGSPYPQATLNSFDVKKASQTVIYDQNSGDPLGTELILIYNGPFMPGGKFSYSNTSVDNSSNSKEITLQIMPFGESWK